MADKDAERALRIEVARELYALGHSLVGIAEALGNNPMTIQSDARELGWDTAFPARPKSPEDVYAGTFVRYAWILRERATETAAGQRSREALAHLVGESLIVAALDGAQQAMQLACRSDVQADPSRERLVHALIKQVAIAGTEPPDAFTQWHAYLDRVCVSDILPPTSRDMVVRDLVAAQVAAMRIGLMPAWTDEASILLDKAIAQLPLREREIICYRYLDLTPATIKQLVKRFHSSEHRVRDAEASALARLCLPEYGLLAYLEPVYRSVIARTVLEPPKTS